MRQRLALSEDSRRYPGRITGETRPMARRSAELSSPSELLRLGGALRHAASASSTAWAANRRTALLQRTLTLPALI